MPVTDPYKVLGVPTTATDDEVKAAYRRLAKRYHPDANPGDKSAEQRMKEINAAYDQIINHTANPTGNRQYGGNSYGGQQYGGNQYGGNQYGGDQYGGFGGFGGFGGYGAGEEESDPRMNAARNYINFGRYREALNVLAGVTDKTARWYYYSALANEGAGNHIVAVQHAQRAVEMDPGIPAYSELLERLQNPGGEYTGYGRAYNIPFSGMSRICGGFLISWLMCMYCNFCCR